MTIKQTLASMVLAGAVAFGSAGCMNPSQDRTERMDPTDYEYDGKIGEEQIEFRANITGIDGHWPDHPMNILTVRKADGRIITYVNKARDEVRNGLKLNYVKIISTGNYGTTYDASNKLDEPIFEQAQRQFDGYLPLLKTAHDQRKKEREQEEFKKEQQGEQERIKEEQQRMKDNPQRIKQALEDLK